MVTSAVIMRIYKDSFIFCNYEKVNYIPPTYMEIRLSAWQELH